ncbi:hypothetical protein [Streptomyces canus]|uniref:hypothetical protein n=1 Tax=Streptomyces canus TaxID=58343 RepID=UPI002E2D033C|nr:hypothetical protein [Streptomyces canus]
MQTGVPLCPRPRTQRLIGTLLTVVFGNRSTGGVNGTADLPALRQDLGPVLPPWNGSTLVRYTL